MTVSSVCWNRTEMFTLPMSTSLRNQLPACTALSKHRAVSEEDDDDGYDDSEAIH